MIHNTYTIRRPFVDSTPDVIVVGSGPGGAACAYRLTMAGKKVYLLEEGWNHPYSFHGRDEVFALSHFFRDKGLLSSLGNPPIPILAGKALGGAARVNQACALRMPESIQKLWIREGLAWVEKKLESFYEEIERQCGVKEVPEHMLNPNVEIFINAIKASGGTPELMKRNAPECDGCGTCVTGCPTLRKKSPDIAFIKPASEEGLTVICGAKALEVKEDKRGVTVNGILTDKEGVKISYFSLTGRYAVISCGAIYTPLLLMNSRHPDPTGRIGKRLFLHPTALVFGIHEEEVDGFDGIPMQAYTHSFFETTGCVIESMFLMPLLALVGIPGTPQELLENFKSYRHMSMGIVQRWDSFPGEVKKVGNAPFILYNLTFSDEKGIEEGVRIYARGLLEAGAKKVLVQSEGGKTFKTVTDVEKTSLSFSSPGSFIYSAHPQGSCCAGEDEDKYPVRPDLSLRPGEKIFVADTSVFPYPTGVNPMLTAMAVGFQAADEILNRL